MAVFFMFEENGKGVYVVKSLLDGEIMDKAEFERKAKLVDLEDFINSLKYPEKEKIDYAYRRFMELKKKSLAVIGCERAYNHDEQTLDFKCCVQNNGEFYCFSAEEENRFDEVLELARKQVIATFGETFYLKYKQDLFNGWSYFVDGEKTEYGDYYKYKLLNDIYRKAYNVKYFVRKTEKELVERYKNDSKKAVDKVLSKSSKKSKRK